MSKIDPIEILSSYIDDRLLDELLYVNMPISFAITANDEDKELDRLLSILEKCVILNDEIVVLLDSSTTAEVKEIIDKHKDSITNYSFHSLNNDFATHKNFLNRLCTNDYIFQIDADEIPTYELIETLRIIVDNRKNKNLDAIRIPRVNIVNNITDEYLQQQHWTIDETGVINYPDYQTRFYKNDPSIR